MTQTLTQEEELERMRKALEYLSGVSLKLKQVSDAFRDVPHLIEKAYLEIYKIDRLALLTTDLNHTHKVTCDKINYYLSKLVNSVIQAQVILDQYIQKLQNSEGDSQ